jgi:hypothetical protein
MQAGTVEKSYRPVVFLAAKMREKMKHESISLGGAGRKCSDSRNG